MRYLKQALAMMREERLYSAIYIAGTALAIAFVMLIAEVYYVQVADIAPEVNRSRTYYLPFMGKNSDDGTVESISQDVFRDLFQKMQTPESVTGVVNVWASALPYMKLADGIHDCAVKVRMTEPGYFDFYRYRFIEGSPFTQDDFDSRRRVCVVTEEVWEKLYGNERLKVKSEEGKNEKYKLPASNEEQSSLEGNSNYSLFTSSLFTVEIDNRPYRICGVVETPSALTERACADIIVPWTAEGLFARYHTRYEDMAVDVYFAVKASCRKAFMQELREVQARYNAMHPSDPVDTFSELKSHYATVWRNLNFLFDVYDGSIWWYVAAAILLLLFVPALNLSSMVASRMERRLPEMAVRKAFGAKRRTLLAQVIMENLMLTLVGGLVGLCLAWAALYGWRDWVFYAFSEDSTLMDAVPVLKGEMLFGPAVFGIALLVCCVLNILAATVPAWLSLRKPIVESMMIKK